MRYKRLGISPEVLFELLRGRHDTPYEVIQDGVPKDAQLVNVTHGFPNYIEILIESAEFKEVPEGALIPLLVPIITVNL